MAEVHELTRAEARQIAVTAQLLAQPRPDDVLEVVHRLCVVQEDPTKAVAPSAELVLWSRIGSALHIGELSDLVDQQRLINLRGMLRPAEDLALHRAEMAVWPGTGALRPWQVSNAEWVETNDECRRDLLERLRGDGPLPLSELPDTCVAPWRSSGWNDDKNVQMLLGLMVQRGEVAAAGRDERGRLWDLAERVYPDDPVPPVEEALRIRAERRLASLGIARAKAPLGAEVPGEVVDLGDVGEPAVIEGVRGTWRVDPCRLGEPFTGRAALLSPLDRMIHDRKRMAEVFEFDYQLEMYKPAAKRRWGYYALPILYDDRLVGKLDATADRKAGALFVDAVHEDVPFTRAMTRAVDAEIADLADWLRLELVRK